MHRIFLFLFFVWLIAAPARAEDNEFSIGSVVMKVGSPEAKTLAALREHYALGELNGGVWHIGKKEDPRETVGLVQVRDGQVIWASRDRGAFEGAGAQAFGQAFFDAIASLNPEDKQQVELTTEISVSPVYNVNTITLGFPGRQMLVHINRKGDLVAVSMEEILIP